MCDPCCFILGCDPVQERIERPADCGELPEKMMCPHCSTISKPVYKREKNILTLCFIPLWPCGKGSPYIGCDNCNNKVGMMRGGACRQCNVAMPFENEYCANCGTRRVGGETRSLNVR